MAVPGVGMTNFNGVQLDGVSQTVNLIAITVLLRDPNGDILLCSGATVPTDTSSGYSKAGLFLKTNAVSGTGGLYSNKGTNTSSIFSLVTQA